MGVDSMDLPQLLLVKQPSLQRNSAALLLRSTDDKVSFIQVHEPLVVEEKISELATKNYKLKVASEGTICIRILAKTHLSIFLLHNYSGGDNTAACQDL